MENGKSWTVCWIRVGGVWYLLFAFLPLSSALHRRMIKLLFQPNFQCTCRRIQNITKCTHWNIFSLYNHQQKYTKKTFSLISWCGCMCSNFNLEKVVKLSVIWSLCLCVWLIITKCAFIMHTKLLVFQIMYGTRFRK